MGKNISFRLKRNILGVLVVLFGFLYVPVFEHSMYWAWIFPFTILAALYFRTELEYSLEKSLEIEDEGKRSWVMSYRSMIIILSQTMVCALPFILVLWLYRLGFIEAQYASNFDKVFYDYVLSFMPSNRLPKEIDYSNGILHVILGCTYFTMISLIVFSIFSFKKIRAVRRVVYNTDMTFEETQKIWRIMPHNILAVPTMLVSLVMFTFFLIAVPEVLNASYTLEVLATLFFALVFFSVFTVFYGVGSTAIQSRKIKR